MRDSLTHRGPDGQGLFTDGPVGLAMRRLSIIDLETGDQPIGNEDGSIQVVLNGEIYNYPDLRRQLQARGHRFRTRSDTETIVHAYEQWGTDCLGRLNGMFAFALWDGGTRELFIARDRAGIKPLYYAQVGGRLVFASELRALLASGYVERRLDIDALSDYLSLEYVPTPASILADVRRLRPGHFLRASEHGVGEHPYWDLDLTRSEREPLEGSIAAQADRFADVLRRSIASEMLSDVPVGVLLSGGLDSSTVAALMAEMSNEPVQSFSITFDEPSFDEGPFARAVAAHIGARHRELRLDAPMMLDLIPTLAGHIDEPFADPSIIPTYLVSRFAREHVKVVLGGDGGDELLAGYSTLQAHRLAPFYAALPSGIRARLIEPALARLPVSSRYMAFEFLVKRFVLGADEPAALRHQMWTGAFYGRDKAEILTPDARAEVSDGGFEHMLTAVANASGAAHPLNRVLYQDFKLYMEGDILTKVDRASMATSLETRVPLLNLEVLDFLQRVPVSHKLRAFRRKYLLRRAVHDLLPREIIGRRKRGFSIPVAAWLNGELRGLAREYLDESRLRREGLFDSRTVARLVREHADHTRNNAKMLWTLLMFQLWRERWLDAA